MKIPGLERLKAGLSKTRDQIGRLLGRPSLSDDWMESLESALIAADVGARTSAALVAALKADIRSDPIDMEGDPQAPRTRLARLVQKNLTALVPPQTVMETLTQGTEAPAPRVIMLVGVNGAGKTTSIGKLTHFFQAQGQRVLLGAADTFRAAAQAQLTTWGQRNGVEVIAQANADPAAIAFDAVKAGQARGMQVVLVDTAGRLPTQLHLMEELKKVKRVTAKAMEGAPHEVWLVIDGGTGQNALAQVRAFDEALGLTGLIVTKLDGTAKGGVLLALAAERPIPVVFLGVGEGLEDLQPFDPQAFAEALL
ncbi:MAG: signal recognition particle-docking protein FtsY [Burkholderiaceae bacterium]